MAEKAGMLEENIYKKKKKKDNCTETRNSWFEKNIYMLSELQVLLLSRYG